MDGKFDIDGGSMKYFVAFLSFLFVAGCTLFPPNPDGFKKNLLETKYLTFSVWEKEGIQSKKPLRIYLEGDGNPNPTDQIALYYAQKDPSTNVIYMARPCQWSDDKVCKDEPEIYREQRFHPQIIRETQEIILLLIDKYQAPYVELVGFDGGATVALNLANKLSVKRVITIAGILDTVSYTYQNNLPEMTDAENPADNLLGLAQVAQIHYVGEDDQITPIKVAERFVRQMNNPKSAVVKKVPGVGHSNWKGVALDY